MTKRARSIVAGVIALVGALAVRTLLAQRDPPATGTAADMGDLAVDTEAIQATPLDVGGAGPESTRAVALDLAGFDAAPAAEQATAGVVTGAEQATAPPPPLVAPEGYAVSEYAVGLAGARSLALGSAGTLFVGSRHDRVHAVRDDDGDGTADRVTVVARRLDAPAGVAFAGDALFVIEPERVLRLDDIERRLDLPPDPVVVSESLPRQRLHRLRTARFGPDGLLYVAIGAPCDACTSDDPAFASISYFQRDFGSRLERYAEGVRSCSGLDWDPVTGALWFTDNGRERIGNWRPPDELDTAPFIALQFGFPWCYGAGVYDDSLGDETYTRCDWFVAPRVELDPGAGAMGMRFYDGGMFPIAAGTIFVAEAGDERRAGSVGRRVSLVSPSANGTFVVQPFVVGWIDALTGEPWGRPVDVEVLADGALAVSDEWTGSIWRIAYGG